jgi:hypothetical protein
MPDSKHIRNRIEQAKGKRAHKAITSVPTNAAKAVAVNKAFLSMPVALKIFGLTERM